MSGDRIRQTVLGLLSGASVNVGGSEPWDIAVHDDRFYGRVLSRGSLGLGESYMDGWWDCAALDEFFFHVLRAQIHDRVKKDWHVLRDAALARALNLQSERRAFQIGERHYDLGNDLFLAMLGKTMAYSCAYWKQARTLDEAQEAKMELICRKLQLQPGMTMLDIGCGWGSLIRHAAQKHGVKAVGITVSREQVGLARDLCTGLPVDIRLQDYRDVKEEFDRVVSVGMVEHVGYKNYRTFMRVAHRSLKEDGLFLLHTIGGNRSRTSVDAWINRYVFPNGLLPSVAQLGTAIEGLFVMEDWDNLSVNYDRTLMAWHDNFEKGWDALKPAYGERFHRMWKYYLLSCAGAFRSRGNQLWQIVLSKKGVIGGYNSVR